MHVPGLADGVPDGEDEILVEGDALGLAEILALSDELIDADGVADELADILLLGDALIDALGLALAVPEPLEEIEDDILELILADRLAETDALGEELTAPAGCMAIVTAIQSSEAVNENVAVPVEPVKTCDSYAAPPVQAPPPLWP